MRVGTIIALMLMQPLTGDTTGGAECARHFKDQGAQCPVSNGGAFLCRACDLSPVRASDFHPKHTFFSLIDPREQRFLDRGVAARLLRIPVMFAALAHQASKRLKAERERVAQKTANLF